MQAVAAALVLGRVVGRVEVERVVAAAAAAAHEPRLAHVEGGGARHALVHDEQVVAVGLARVQVLRVQADVAVGQAVALVGHVVHAHRAVARREGAPEIGHKSRMNSS